MGKKRLNQIIVITVLIFLSIIVILIDTSMIPIGSKGIHSGQIFLYGEEHGVESILEKELQLWKEYYHEEGMRHLFVELPYYTAEFLNLWMQSESDEILNELYQDWNGAAIHSEEVKKFYQEIKASCPETVFHGTDVGHQYNTTGKRYLEYLKANGEEKSERYRLAQEAIEQGKYYYVNADSIYRENIMTENFRREFDKLNGEDVMGIYGLAHTNLEAMDYLTHTVPCMANQLKEHYGALIHSEDLTLIARDIEPIKVEKMQIGDKVYEASYFGKVDLSAFSIEYKYREFWRLENAYDDFKNQATTGNVLPYNNYPMIVEEGQVFVIDYTKADDSVFRQYYRSDGNTWEGFPTTEEFEMK